MVIDGETCRRLQKFPPRVFEPQRSGYFTSRACEPLSQSGGGRWDTVLPRAVLTTGPVKITDLVFEREGTNFSARRQRMLKVFEQVAPMLGADRYPHHRLIDPIVRQFGRRQLAVCCGHGMTGQALDPA